MDAIEEILEQVRDEDDNWLQRRNPPWKENPFEIKNLEHRELFTGYK